ncbi:hypothetical protein ACRW9N_10820 [Listeria aquatica]|uniref:hypothetical protein n=1 Tax=Listeria aquatica TaxID=1494960 RepID=UPI003EF385F7
MIGFIYMLFEALVALGQYIYIQKKTENGHDAKLETSYMDWFEMIRQGLVLRCVVIATFLNLVH